jgi:hypothetical protein
MLFDLAKDPDELCDLGRDPAYSVQRDALYKHLHAWGLRMSQRITISDAEIVHQRERDDDTGVILGVYDQDDVGAREAAAYVGKVPPRR